MKKLPLSLVFVAVMLTVSGQEMQPDTSIHPLTKEEYLKESRQQRTGAIILLAGGGAVLMGGLAIAAQHFDLFNLEEERDETLEIVMIVIGGAAMLGSIPVFKSAKKNKLKAMSLSFKNERTIQLQNGFAQLKRIPSLNFTLRF